MKFRFVPLMTALTLAGGVAGQAAAADQARPAGQQTVAASQAQQAPMQALQQSAQQLRESIQAMAQKEPGAERDRAIDRAHQALLDTHRAMQALPRPAATPRSATGAAYEQSVAKLLQAADRLRDSIIAISQQPDGPGRTRALDEAQQALWETRLALVSAYDPGPAGSRVMGAGAPAADQARNAPGTQNRTAGATAGSGSSQPTTALLLVPLQMASDEKLANGCWVRFYDGKNFSGGTLTLVGPVDMPRMYPAGTVWRDWESAVVGAKARVTTYDEENFSQRTANLAPGQRVPDLEDQKLGWFDEVHSARVACTG